MLSVELIHLDGYLGSLITKRDNRGYDMIIDTLRVMPGQDSYDLKTVILNKYPVLKSKWDTAEDLFRTK